MKTLLLLFALTISISLTAQRTSYDVLAELNNKIPYSKTLVDGNIEKMFKEYVVLCVKEIRFTYEYQKLACNAEPNSIILFCFSCECPYCHSIYNYGNGDCRRVAGPCGTCRNDGYQMNLFVEQCQGTCGNWQGKNMIAKQ